MGQYQENRFKRIDMSLKLICVIKAVKYYCLARGHLTDPTNSNCSFLSLSVPHIKENFFVTHTSTVSISELSFMFEINSPFEAQGVCFM